MSIYFIIWHYAGSNLFSCIFAVLVQSEKEPPLLRLTLDRAPGPNLFTFLIISRLGTVGLCRFRTRKDYAFVLCPISVKVVFRNESEEFILLSRSSSVHIPSPDGSGVNISCIPCDLAKCKQ
jgi:hypothetical protein